MSSHVSTIRNLGPASDKAFARAGIRSAEELRELGPDAAYEQLLRHGTRPHFIGYYVLVMGLQGRPWNDCKGEEKKALRKRFDRIKSSNRAAPETQIVSELDAIGVRVTSTDLEPLG